MLPQYPLLALNQNTEGMMEYNMTQDACPTLWDAGEQNQTVTQNKGNFHVTASNNSGVNAGRQLKARMRAGVCNVVFVVFIVRFSQPRLE